MNYLTQEYRIQNPPTSVDINVVDKTLSVLQKKYDQNSAMVEQTLALYNQNLKSLRSQDNQYIATRLKEVKTQIDNYSKKNSNLAYSYNRDSMLSSVQSLMSDPLIQDAITSRQNDMALNAQIEEARKKDPKLVNQGNIDYSRHSGGYYDYMSGKTNKLGAMQYISYSDAKKNINEEIEKYAKGAGLHKEVSAKGGEYFITKTSTERVSRADILKQISNTLDPITQKQLTIDAWVENKDLSDVQVNEKFKGVYTEKIKEIQAENIKLAVEKLKKPKSEQSRYDDKINSNLIGIADYTKAIDSGEISRTAKEYDIYSKKLFNNIADTYERNDVVDIDWNDAPLDIKKFELDSKYKEADYLLKIEDLKLKKYALDNKDSNGNAKSDGTKLTAPPDEDAESVPVDEEARKTLATSYTVLSSQLINDNPQVDSTRKYNDLSKTEQNQYINNVSKGQMPTNLSNKLTPATRTAIAEHASNTKTWNDYRVPKIHSIDKGITDAYTDMLEGLKDPSFRGLNVDGFATSQPRTASALKAKTPFNKLSASEQNAIRAEYSSNMLSLGEYKNGVEERNLKMYKANLSLRKGTDQSTKNYIKNLTDENTSLVGSFFRSAWNSTPINIASTAAEYIGSVGNAILSGTEVMGGKELAKSFVQKQLSPESVRATADFKREMGDTFDPGTDTNITEIEGYDVKSRKNLLESLKSSNTGDTTILERALRTVDDRFGYSYSTKTDGEKLTAGILEKVILNTETGASSPPINDNIYNIKQVGNSYAITYKAKNKLMGEHNEVVMVDAKNIPQEILSKYRTNKQVWAHDASNPNATPPKFMFESPETHEDFLDMRNNIIENYPTMFGETIDRATPFFIDKSTEREGIIKSIGKTKYNTHRDEIEGVINAEFEFTPIVRKGKGFDVVVKVDGQSVSVNGNRTIEGNYNEDLFQKTCLMLATKIKQERFNQILE